jgi:alpha-N-arabinofuranosidase
MMKHSLAAFAVLSGIGLAPSVFAQPDATAPAVLQINADRQGAQVSPVLYGLMTEEINYSYDGGLYAELVRNRTFQDDVEKPVHWSVVQDRGGAGAIALDRSQPLNSALTTVLKLDVTAAPETARVGIANDGFWGIPVRPDTRYRASFYAKAAAGFSGTLTVSLESNDGATVYATAAVSRPGTEWKKYTLTLTTGKLTASVNNRLVIATGGTGTVWFNLVSLFPPTWNDRPNGNRQDIMQLLADLKPGFLRFPGGNYLQGRTLATRFDWKKTLGDVAERPGHLDDAWNYRSSDGMGLLEFLEWCEDLHMQPVLGVFAGFTLRGVPTQPGPDLEPFVQDALDEIEYVTGGANTTWGARRVQDGHPAPFPLPFVEIGNEDNFDRNPGTYEGRYAQFYAAIKAKYPEIRIIATTKVTKTRPDVIDEHFYPRTPEVFQSTHARYDSYDRNGPKVFVGEYATRVGQPTPNLGAALGDAAYMLGMERNSDVVLMASYAPLFVNVNPASGDHPRGMQWPTDLIGYDGLTSYGSPTYYVQKMFGNALGDVVLPIDAAGVPMRDYQPPAPAARRGGPPPAPGAAVAAQPAPEPVAPPPVQHIPTLFFNATRDTQKGLIYLKIVNAAATAQPVRVEVKGVRAVAPQGRSTVLTSASPTDTNSIAEPTKVVPVTTRVDDLGTSFTRNLAPNSVTVLQLQAR